MSPSRWGKCDGTSKWDGNTPGQNGYPCLDQIGHVFGPSPGGANLLEPLYEWNNTHDRADVDLIVGSSHANADRHIVQGRDFINDTPRPGYAPFPYPHPLRSGDPVATPAAPTNLRIISSSDPGGSVSSPSSCVLRLQPAVRVASARLTSPRRRRHVVCHLEVSQSVPTSRVDRTSSPEPFNTPRWCPQASPLLL
jgi:hypothetical protein